ncbi:MarR family transcriptional regulator [Clostridium sardiniense]|uniref:HTH-type transcriptional regulator SarZ n=1 Tax=Clostridium sardiniense TaxID=29369 RepID=A0ABS7L106_CLOSR|nr:MarR family transcriptional regulator [Clostridium sardiniense]MBY0756749.1 MarR family transcriptional regulator [Clostridium sardiniense]MDQ0460434.1 DNA-binding MarR family transcriptional regulator [Clostridium sardiniense]
MDNKFVRDKETRLSLASLIALSRADQKVDKLSYETIRPSGLTASQFAVLEVLYSKGDLKICQIIDSILTTSGNITVIIKNLEKEGFVKKLKDPEDSRAVLISLTEKGREIIESILPKHFENIKNIFSVLDEEEKEQLIKTLSKIRKL